MSLAKFDVCHKFQTPPHEYIFSMTLVVGLQLAVPDNKDIKKLIHYKPIIGGSKENKPITNQEFTKG